jgi:hypothetical protein
MWKAHRLGHRAGIIAVARSLLEDKNPLRKVVGCVMWPFGLIRVMLYARKHPFHEAVFGHSNTRALPLFEQTGIQLPRDAVESGAPGDKAN